MSETNNNDFYTPSVSPITNPSALNTPISQINQSNISTPLSNRSMNTNEFYNLDPFSDPILRDSLIQANTTKTIKLFEKPKEESKESKPKKSKKKVVISKKKKPTEDVKDSGIIAKGKGKSKSKKIPKLLHEGNEKPCKFPFKKGRKYVNEEDGCVEGKTGKWCATEVDKDDDYKYTEWGYCKEE